MRVRFFAPTDESETEAHLGLAREIDAFWSDFAARAKGVSDLAALAAAPRRIRSIHPGLCCELDEHHKGQFSCVVRPLQHAERKPLADWVISRAPRVSHWRYGTVRPRRSLKHGLQRVHQKTGLDLGHAKVRAGVGRGHLLELIVQCGEFSVADDPKAIRACETLAQAVLGDDTVDTWVGSIRTIPGPKASSLRVVSKPADKGPVFHPLELLVDVVDGGIEGIQAGLDERPYHRFCEHADWTLLDVEPKQGISKCAAQDDLALCSTMLPEMMKCFLQGERFRSARFSNHGEVFAYLKYGGLGGQPEARLAQRQRLEDSLNRALVPGAVGCVVGGGLGLRYGYVDMALVQVDAGIELVRGVFARSEIAGPAWVLFFDSEWALEWVGISGGATPPPDLPRRPRGAVEAGDRS